MQFNEFGWPTVVGYTSNTVNTCQLLSAELWHLANSKINMSEFDIVDSLFKASDVPT